MSGSLLNEAVIQDRFADAELAFGYIDVLNAYPQFLIETKSFFRLKAVDQLLSEIRASVPDAVA